MSVSINNNSAGVGPEVVSELVLKKLEQCINALSTMQQKASEQLPYTEAINELKSLSADVKSVVRAVTVTDVQINQIKTAAFFKVGLQKQLDQFKVDGQEQIKLSSIKPTSPG